MRYEPFRMARNNELHSIAYRRLIAAIDWVENLTGLLDFKLSIEDKVKHSLGYSSEKRTISDLSCKELLHAANGIQNCN